MKKESGDMRRSTVNAAPRMGRTSFTGGQPLLRRQDQVFIPKPLPEWPVAYLAEQALRSRVAVTGVSIIFFQFS
jgi:hypothetical protein